MARERALTGAPRYDHLYDDDGRRAMAAKFVVKKGSTGKFRFNLVASNGEIIATSEAYNSKASAMKGIESVRKNAPTATVDDQTT